MVTPAACTALPGTYQGDGAACDPNPCSPAVCRGDANCDGGVNWRDIDFFVAGMSGQAAWESMFLPGTPDCPYGNCDANGDTAVNWRDIDPLVALMNTTCP